MRNCVPNLSSA